MKLLVLFSVYCPLKILAFVAINPEHVNLLVVTETGSLGGQEPENDTNNFRPHYQI